MGGLAIANSVRVTMMAAMAKRVMDLTGQTFGRYRVVSESNARGYTRYWRCVCECGVERDVAQNNLTRGLSKSCGCLGRENAAKSCASRARHGHARVGMVSRTYTTWQTMVRRCEDPDFDGFENYGARGISVCPRWRSSFDAFLEDVGERPAGKTLDRIDVNGHYEPSNVKWSTYKEQSANRRPVSEWKRRAKKAS